MHRVQGAKCAISKLVYGSSVCMDDNHSLKLVAYRPDLTDVPYTKLHIICSHLIFFIGREITHDRLTILNLNIKFW